MKVPAEFDNDVSIVYTYSVTFEVSKILHKFMTNVKKSSFLIKGQYLLRSCLHVVFMLQENTSIKWASRWDYILVSMPHTNIQWFRYEVIVHTFPFKKDHFVLGWRKN